MPSPTPDERTVELLVEDDAAEWRLWTRRPEPWSDPSWVGGQSSAWWTC